MATEESSDPLLVACAAMMREVGGYNMDPERLVAALPIIRSTAAAVRTLDELDVQGAEPMTVFRPLP